MLSYHPRKSLFAGLENYTELGLDHLAKAIENTLLLRGRSVEIQSLEIFVFQNLQALRG